MRLKLDENLPGELARLFIEAGHDAVTILDQTQKECDCHVLGSFAYLMMKTLRRVSLAGAKLAGAQDCTLRRTLLKIGAQVQVTTRKVSLSFCESYPLTRLSGFPKQQLRSCFRFEAA